jgi:hypothetical protein
MSRAVFEIEEVDASRWAMSASAKLSTAACGSRCPRANGAVAIRAVARRAERWLDGGCAKRASLIGRKGNPMIGVKRKR